MPKKHLSTVVLPTPLQAIIALYVGDYHLAPLLPDDTLAALVKYQPQLFPTPFDLITHGRLKTLTLSDSSLWDKDLAWEIAFSFSNLQMIQWMHEHWEMVPCGENLVYAAHAGHLHLVEWLWEHMSDDEWHKAVVEAYRKACSRSHVRVATFLKIWRSKSI